MKGFGSWILEGEQYHAVAADFVDRANCCAALTSIDFSSVNADALLLYVAH